MTTRTLTTRKGKTVETTMTDAEALAVLRSLEEPSSFAADLVRKHERYGLSHDQMVWVHVLACEAVTPAEEPEAVQLPEIVALLARAREAGLKWPKIRLQTQAGDRVVLSLAGERAREPGSVNVTDGGPYGDNVWYGRISTGGAFTPSRKATEEITALLEAFNGDPAGTGAIHGAMTGCCSFCGRELTTRESVGAGYGPVCAEKWGLPWGAETAARYEEVREEALAR